ncbi:L,D-transpeptidase family protein [Luteimicrobium subarcticum]|uniref:Putative peptidoglycan binding protein n=1 Tax=Luteimicrobium subarcticum TaxID=620910 RepID=A0A2M8WVM0_9MICO|nr:L,D-transpeptidase family protein [Luteimicrobium subarcticum]PJI94946.1 putative peptidoglycan binding protein [Luteimicrobium subarcticum]
MTLGRGLRTRTRRTVAAAALGTAAMVLVAGCGASGTSTGMPSDAPGPQVTTAEATGPTTPSPTTTTEPPAGSPSPTEPVAPTTATTPEPAATSTPEPTSSAASSTPKPTKTARVTEHKDLRSGDSGARVLALQKKLLANGYWITDADGSFGPSTLQAVWALQKVAGLGRDGVVGPKTLAAVEAGTLPTPRSRSGHVIEVDLAKQVLLIVDDGHVTTVLNASTGSGKQFSSPSGPSKGTQFTAVTPTGTYRIGRQYDALYESRLGLGKMWRPKFFNGGIAIHGLWYDVPPYPASHGCVRVSNPAMDWIWSADQAPQGTTVIVY